jgi:bifunctional UDP-N-acetylglucosamine pyrophosphorylase/glucosamine-1-phosphate N-acetyltransferase
MRSARQKVLHGIGGETLLGRVLSVAKSLEPSSVTVVIGHQGNQVEPVVRALGHAVVHQTEQRGTAHALQQAEGALRGRNGTLLLLSGDVPLLEGHTLQKLVTAHTAARAAATVVTAVVARPFGYGRIIRNGDALERIVEEKDASLDDRAVCEINAGIYAFELPTVWDGLREIDTKNQQGEFYLTDLVGIFRRQNREVKTLTIGDVSSVLGVNSRRELAEAGRIVRERKLEELMAAGVTVIDPASTYIDTAVEVGVDSVIHPGVVLEGRTKVGTACELHAYVRITDSILGDRVIVNNFCVLVDAQVADESTVGPFAHLRPGTVVGRKAKVGNFVELKKTTLGEGSKVNHLSYLGDARVGTAVNVGAGTITCNYDGVKKHVTVIEDGAFIGSGSQLVAPVTIGKDAYVAAGSSITEDVPASALGVARQRQHNVKGWAKRPGHSKD